MHKFFHLVSALVCLGLSSAVLGQPEMGPEADKVLKGVQSYMAGLSSLSIKADTTEESVYGDKHKLQFGGSMSIGVQAPAQFFATVHEHDRNRRMYLNDGTFTVFDEDVNVYAQASTQGSISEVFARLHAKFGISTPGGELFSGKAYELLVNNASRVVYVGADLVSGVACHHIAGVLENMDWQLWVRKDGDPELCKYVVTDRDVPMAPQYSITFREWTANAEFSDQQFTFRAPADAEAIEFVK